MSVDWKPRTKSIWNKTINEINWRISENWINELLNRKFKGENKWTEKKKLEECPRQKKWSICL